MTLRSASFSFDEPELRNPGVLPLLQAAHDRTANDVLPALTDLMRCPLTVQALPPRFTRYADFVDSQPQPAHIAVMGLRPFRTSAAWALAPELVRQVVDRMFGGSGRGADGGPARSAGVVERRLVMRVAGLFARQYAAAWHRIQAIEFPSGRYEFDARLAQLGSPQETVLRGGFSLRFSDGGGGDVDLCIPWRPLRPAWLAASGQLQSTAPPESSRWDQRLRRELQSASVDLVATLSEQRTTLGQAMSFSVGDLIPIEVGDRVRLHVDGQPLLEGQHGASRGRYAVKVTRATSAHEALRTRSALAPLSEPREETPP